MPIGREEAIVITHGLDQAMSAGFSDLPGFSALIA